MARYRKPPEEELQPPHEKYMSTGEKVLSKVDPAYRLGLSEDPINPQIFAKEGKGYSWRKPIPPEEEEEEEEEEEQPRRAIGTVPLDLLEEVISPFDRVDESSDIMDKAQAIKLGSTDVRISEDSSVLVGGANDLPMRSKQTILRRFAMENGRVLNRQELHDVTQKTLDDHPVLEAQLIQMGVLLPRGAEATPEDPKEASQQQRIVGAAHAVRLGEAHVRIPQDPKFLHGGLNGTSHRVKNVVVRLYEQKGQPLELEELSPVAQAQLEGDPVLRVQLQQIGALWIPDKITDVAPLTPEEEAEMERHNRELDVRELLEAGRNRGIPEGHETMGGSPGPRSD